MADFGLVRVVACCGMPRPINNDGTIFVRLSKVDGPEGGHVTVRDYVTTLHPWVIGLRSDLFAALAMGEDRKDPLPDGPVTALGWVNWGL